MEARLATLKQFFILVKLNVLLFVGGGAVNNHNLKVNIILDKNGTPCETGVLEVVLDGMSVNLRHFPRRPTSLTPTPQANGPVAAAPRTTNANTPSRPSHQ